MQTQTYIFDRDQLLRAIRNDCELFFAFYLKEELTLEIPEFHKEIWQEFLDLLEEANDPSNLTEVLKKLIGVPREHSKTTIVKLAIVLFMRYSRLGFTAYISNTFNVALNALKDVRNWFKSQHDQELYGPYMAEKDNESVGEFIFTIHSPIMNKPKKVILKAYGVNTQLRGNLIDNRRPDLMIFDDCESRETAENPVLQAKLDAWCFGTAIKAMAKGGLIVFIGNMLTETSLLARLSKVPEWRAVVFGSIIRDAAGQLRPLWEGRWTLEKLFAEYSAFRAIGTGHIWEAEMMNLTAKDILGDSLENAWRPITPSPEDIEAGFLCLDPAFGENRWNDESAITVHVKQQGVDLPMVVDSWTDRVNDEQLLDKMIEFSYIWGITTWCIEAVAAQKLLIPLFRANLVIRHMAPDLFLMIPITGGKEAKFSRIISFKSSVAAGSYGVSESCEVLFKKLSEYYPGVEHDDEEDSASFGLQVWDLHGSVVKSQGRFDIAGALFDRSDSASGNTSGFAMDV